MKLYPDFKWLPAPTLHAHCFDVPITCNSGLLGNYSNPGHYVIPD